MKKEKTKVLDLIALQKVVVFCAKNCFKFSFNNGIYNNFSIIQHEFNSKELHEITKFLNRIDINFFEMGACYEDVNSNLNSVKVSFALPTIEVDGI
jgi:hypothetical protein